MSNKFKIKRVNTRKLGPYYLVLSFVLASVFGWIFISEALSQTPSLDTKSLDTDAKASTAEIVRNINNSGFESNTRQRDQLFYWETT